MNILLNKKLHTPPAPCNYGRPFCFWAIPTQREYSLVLIVIVVNNKVINFFPVDKTFMVKKKVNLAYHTCVYQDHTQV